jgi:hypothetical protein
MIISDIPDSFYKLCTCTTRLMHHKLIVLMKVVKKRHMKPSISSDTRSSVACIRPIELVRPQHQRREAVHAPGCHRGFQSALKLTGISTGSLKLSRDFNRDPHRPARRSAAATLDELTGDDTFVGRTAVKGYCTQKASTSLIMASNSCFPCKQVGDEAGRGRPRGVRALGGAAGPARGARQQMDVGEQECYL